MKKYRDMIGRSVMRSALEKKNASDYEIAKERRLKSFVEHITKNKKK